MRRNPRRWPTGRLRDVFLFLEHELNAAGWTASLPVAAEIEAAVGTGDMGSIPRQRLLTRYAQAYDAAGPPFPESLRTNARQFAEEPTP